MEEFRGRRKAVKDLSALLAKPQRSPAPEVSMLAATCSLQQGDASTSPWVAACLGLAWKQPAGARHLLGTRDPMHHHPTRPPSLSGSRPKHQERDEAAQHCHGHAAPAQKGAALPRAPCGDMAEALGRAGPPSARRFCRRQMSCEE